MKANFNDTVNILVKAYLNDTLEHLNCYACAVGNIVAAKNGYHYTKCIDEQDKVNALVENEGRYNKLFSVGGTWYGHVKGIHSHGDDEIASTGYTGIEIVMIENAFEGADRGNTKDEWMFNGLMAVVDVLAEIHNVDLTQRESAKLLFVK